MKALSIQQPWADLIIHAGKDIENRTWGTRYRGELYIHASKRFDTKGYFFLRNNFQHLGFTNAGQIGDLLERMSPKNVQQGGIIGKVELVDCVKEHSSPWKAEDSYGFVLRNPVSLPFVPMLGKLGLFEVAL